MHMLKWRNSKWRKAADNYNNKKTPAEKVTLDYHRITKFHMIPKSNVNKTL